MTQKPADPTVVVAIACGGTGGHLFPGLAVGRALQATGIRILLVVSEKSVDQEVVQGLTDLEVLTLPAVGFGFCRLPRFIAGIWQSRRTCHEYFRRSGVSAVLGMGGFTSVAPLWAGRSLGAATFLHESNSVPGRANRLAARRWVDEVFVGFEAAAGRLSHGRVTHTGTPVRTQFVPRDARECRAELGLDRERPVLLISGGSQGAEALNRVVIDGLSAFRREVPELQFVHITGKAGYREVREAHATSGTRACVRPFLEPMETAMGAATLALSRAGASSMAEMAAMRLPAILVPYPQAADDHQWFNAQAFVDMEAALCRAQAGLNSEWLVPAVAALVRDEDRLRKMKQALEGCYHPRAAERIAEAIRAGLARRGAQGFYAESDAGSAESPSQTREGRRTSSLQAV